MKPIETEPSEDRTTEPAGEESLDNTGKSSTSSPHPSILAQQFTADEGGVTTDMYCPACREEIFGTYTKEITSKFSSGRVDEDQVEALRTAQRNAIAAVFKNLEAAVNKENSRVVSCLEKTQREFTADLVKDIVADLEKLGKQLKEREKSLKEYDELLAVL